MKKDDVKIGGKYIAKVSDKLVTVRIENENRHGGWDATNLETGKQVRVKSAQRLRGESEAGGKSKVKKSKSAADAGASVEDRCSTSGCPNPPTITHLDRRLCDACWARHCEDEDRGNKDNAAPDVAEAAPAAPVPNVGDAVVDGAVPLAEALAASDLGKANAESWDAATPGGKKRRAKKEPAEAKPKRTSALDAAAVVLEMAGKPMHCNEMIQAMAEEGLWSSPNGKTPAATLYSAILREIGTKGTGSRFAKSDRGQFTFNRAGA